MRKYIYFIRHGECLSNLDPHFSGEDLLSENGLKQAIFVAKRFKHVAVDAIYHSGILRTQKTAEEIERITDVKSEAKGFLKERRGAFSSEGIYGYVEDFAQLKLRLTETKSFLESLSSKHTVIVSHAIFLKALAAYLTHGDSLSEDLVRNFDVVLIIDNTGVSKCMFNKENGKWRIMSWNDLAHLTE
ncbi:MAG: histidine phosphatase family protein [Candidatus Pacebacteria bacterium]|nr:histidine phosphatase family protein [Candidatus Paceibacterota bacterium]MBP9750000.1 histidine phosphatase family protein [Candidatus Paceibacterota bacterium]